MLVGTTRRQLALMVAAGAACGFTSLASGQQAADGVNAGLISDEVVPGDPSVREPVQANAIDELRNAGPDRPMPLGDDSMMGESTLDPAEAGRWVSYDPKTGIETIGPRVNLNLDAPLAEQWVAGQNGIDHFDGETENDYMFGGRNFGSLSQVATPSNHPWNKHCKLRMLFSDGWYVCSGTLIDARTILTAGHCINKGNGGEWADEVWVFPGYEDNDGVGYEVYEDAPFGRAELAGQVSYTGWTQNGDFSYDIGYVRLSKPIGWKTGWNGYGYNDNCSFFTSGTHYNQSYPAEAAYGWNGRFMYQRSGDFDSCPFTNRVQYNSAGYGGMSGSSSYVIDNDSRYSYSVASTSDRATYTRHCDLWQSAFEYVRDTFIPDGRASGVDLWALCTTADQTSMNAGQSTTGLRWLTGNWSTNTSFNSTVSYTVRLSTNDLISAGDTQLSSQSVGLNLGQTGASYVNSVNVTIPIGTSSGTYWLGHLISNTDANSGNNDSSGLDAWPISVTAVRDPEAVSVGFPGTTAYHGSSYTTSYSVRNNGAASAFSVMLDFRASTNTLITTSDTPLGTVNLGTMTGGQVINSSTSLTIPSSITGSRYIGVIITTSSTDADGTNNTAYDATQVNIQGRSNLEANAISGPSGSLFVGEPFNVTHRTLNSGTIASGNYNVDVRASTNDFISISDTLIRTDAYGTLGAGSSRTDSVSTSLPAVLAPGNWYIGMWVTPGVNENDTVDNGLAETPAVSLDFCPNDWNQDGNVNTNDFVAYLNDYNRVQAGGSWAFQNPDIAPPIGVLNTADFVTFLNIFNTRCY